MPLPWGSGIDLAVAFASRDALSGIDRDAKEYDRLMKALRVNPEPNADGTPFDGEGVKDLAKKVVPT